MKPNPTRTGLSLAIAALLAAPGAFAQDPAPIPPTEPAPAGSSDEQQGERATELGAVEVRGQYIPEPLLESSEVISVVTREDFARQGDSDAAEALTRVAGLSLAEGKFIYVRGLNERYSSALLNGSPLPSPEPLKRVVPLDLFPANVLETVHVQKTYSARYPGEFGGGVIDLRTVGTPDIPFLTLSVGTGGNSETTFRDGLTYYGSDSDWFGYDDGTRKLPAELRAAMETGRRIDQGSFSQDELKRIGASFVNAPLNLLQAKDSIDPDFNIDGSAGRSFELGEGLELGLLAVAGFRNQWRTQFGVQQEGGVEDERMTVRSDYEFLATENTATVNALVGAGLEGANHRVNLTTLYVHDTSKEARSRHGYSDLTGAEIREDNTLWFERELVDTQLAGGHTFGEYRDIEVDWRLSHARASRESPYEKGITYRLVDGRYRHNASQEQNYTRFGTVTDRVDSAGVDVHWNLPTERSLKLHFGGAWLDNERSAWQREFRFLALNGPLPFLVQYQRPDFLFSDFNLYQGFLTLRETTGANGAAAYDASLETRAAYVELEAGLLENVRATAGLRYEDGTQTVQPIDLFGGTPPAGAAPLENAYLLPAFNLTWGFGENMQLRLAASRTIARPQFRELAPQQYLDLDSDRVFIGNPFLVDSELVNLDARFEWYFDDREYFNVGLFHKNIERPVESIVNEAGATVQQTFINAPEASLYGVELDTRMTFGEDWMPVGHLFLGANYTWSKSEVGVDGDDVVFPLAGNGQPRPAAELVRDGSQMQGQSEHLANLQFGYEHPASRSQAIVLVNYASERISARGRPGQPDLIQEPGTMVDLVLRKGFMLGSTALTLGFEARNLLGEEYQEYQELGGGRVDLNRYDLGRSYSFSIGASF